MGLSAFCHASLERTNKKKWNTVYNPTEYSAAEAASPGRVLLPAMPRPGPLPAKKPWGREAAIPSAPTATDGPPPRAAPTTPAASAPGS